MSEGGRTVEEMEEIENSGLRVDEESLKRIGKRSLVEV